MLASTDVEGSCRGATRKSAVSTVMVGTSATAADGPDGGSPEAPSGQPLAATTFAWPAPIAPDLGIMPSPVGEADELEIRAPIALDCMCGPNALHPCYITGAARCLASARSACQFTRVFV